MNMTPIEVLELAKQLMTQHGLVDWTVAFTDAKRIHGDCDSYAKLIRLKRRDVFDRDLRFVKDTILHEIAHALCPRGVPCHGKEWRDIAYRIGVRDPGYGRYRLNAKVRLPKPPTDYNKKLNLAEKNIKRLSTRIKRLRTAMTKWQRRVNLYRRKVDNVQLKVVNVEG